MQESDNRWRSSPDPSIAWFFSILLKQEKETPPPPFVAKAIDNEAETLLSPRQRSGSAALGESEVNALSPRLSFITGLLQPPAFADAAANLLRLRPATRQARV